MNLNIRVPIWYFRVFMQCLFLREIIDITSLESVNKVNLWSHQVNYNYQKPRYINMYKAYQSDVCQQGQTCCQLNL